MARESSEEAGDEAPAPLVGTGDDPIDCLVLTSDGPVRLPATVGARASMERRDVFFMGLAHGLLPP
jgi:hypothetical protein